MNHAVLVGINSYKHVSGLGGCINDVDDVAKLLSSSGAVPESNISKLIDASATKVAIMQAIKDILSKLKAGERAYFHFSGHGVQLPATGSEEIDGVDEVLCAYDFDWTAETAIVDDELYRALLERPAGSEVIVTLDCCHSGDQLRDLRVRPRTLRPPAAIASELARRKGAIQGFRKVSRSPGVSFLSACSPWEVAADTSFNGRANGAFSYYFLRAEEAQPRASLDEVAFALRSDLARYAMTPVAEGDVQAMWLPSGGRYLRDAHSRSTALVRGSTVLYEQSFSATFAGQSVGLHVRISADNGQVLLTLALSMLGQQVTVPPLAISGDQRIDIPLGFLGARIEVSVQGWSVDPTSIRFQLGLSLLTSMWFVPPVTIAQIPITLPLSQLSRAVPAAATPADLVALLSLNGLDRTAEVVSQPSVQAFRDPRLQVFASGVAGWGPNWREDRLIRPFADRPRPEGIQRLHVEIGPQRGAGNVYVVGWASAQETDFDFILHMGNNFFGGWGDIDWRVVGFYYDQSPFPRSVPALTQGASNGNGKSSTPEVAVTVPRGNGAAQSY